MSPETVRLLTLGIALVALLLSVISLVWQVISWRYTGSFVRVENDGKYKVYPEGPPHGYLVSVTARNVGRGDVTISGLSFAVRGRKESLMTFRPDYWQGPKLPYRLQAGDKVDFRAGERALLDGMTGKPDSAEVLAQVFLATGRRRVARKRLRKDWIRIDRTEPDSG